MNDNITSDNKEIIISSDTNTSTFWSWAKDSMKKSIEQAKIQAYYHPVVIITNGNDHYERTIKAYLNQGYNLVSENSLEKQKYSIVKGAVLGTVLGVATGGLGLVVGGMAGNTQKNRGKYRLVFQRPRPLEVVSNHKA